MATKKQQSRAGLVLGRLLWAVQTYGWIVILLLVAVLTLSAIAHRESGRIAHVNPVVIPLPNQEMLTTEAEVLDVLSRSFTIAMDQLTLSDIDVERVEMVLESQPFVANADAFVDDDLTLHVTVEQRVPLLRIMAENGQNYYFDEDGIRMPLSETFTARVPVVTGNIVPWSNDFREDDDHQLSQLVALARYLREDDFLDALVEQIDVSNTGELRLAPKVGDQVIYLGRYDAELTPARLTKLKTFYREGLPYEGWRKYEAFDLRYADQVVARKR